MKIKHSIKMALLFAGIYIVAELVLVFSGHNRTTFSSVFSFSFNTLCLLLAVTIAILVNFNRHKKNGLSMLEDIKTGLTTSSVYAVIIALFITFYYLVLDPGYTQYRVEERIAAMQTPEALAALEQKMLENPEHYSGKSVADIQEMNMDGVVYILDAKKAFPITLFSLLLLGMVYSFLIMALNRMVLSKLM
jgi:hypothetical protein